ncbi:MAG TPA: hypothetical protein VKE41_22605 [Roseiflexaceae bacterium]|nr:hypothetical protein [Roseiflexaceae bacterium]
MMEGYVVRALIALLLAVFLFVRARATTEQPHRRRAFILAAAALLAFVAYNGTLAAGGTVGPLQVGLAIAGMALFVGSIVSLLFSWRYGELRGEREQLAAAVREYREQHAKHDE